jgi:hypothetical protein
VNRYHLLRLNQFANRLGDSFRTHGEVSANANQGNVRSIELVDQDHIAEHVNSPYFQSLIRATNFLDCQGLAVLFCKRPQEVSLEIFTESHPVRGVKRLVLEQPKD